ncbi:MAG: FAD-dependent oxidoreductase [Actinobacteria bacterium]|nr:FAD-dependent oxidoreductase [Actinomycetota bacterium]
MMQDATLIQVEQLNNNTVSYWLKPTEPIDYLAGQFITVHLPHRLMDERGDKRWFTLSSSPTEPLLCFTTKISQKGSSFKRQLQSLKVGDSLQAGQPMGDFVLPKSKHKPLIYIAAGIGIAPVRSILTYLEDKAEQRDVRIHYGVRHEQDMCYKAMLSNWSSATTVWVSQPSASWSGAKGRLSIDAILKQLSPAQRSNSLFFVAGPEQFTQDCAQQLAKSGIPSHHVIGDYYHGY